MSFFMLSVKSYVSSLEIMFARIYQLSVRSGGSEFLQLVPLQ